MYSLINACANALLFSALIAAVTCRSQLCLLNSLKAFFDSLPRFLFPPFLLDAQLQKDGRSGRQNCLCVDEWVELKGTREIEQTE